MKKIIPFVIVVALIAIGCEKIRKDDSPRAVNSPLSQTIANNVVPSTSEYKKMISDILSASVSLEKKEKNILVMVVPGEFRSFHMNLLTAIHQYRLKNDFNTLVALQRENEWISSSIDLLKK